MHRFGGDDRAAPVDEEPAFAGNATGLQHAVPEPFGPQDFRHGLSSGGGHPRNPLSLGVVAARKFLQCVRIRAPHCATVSNAPRGSAAAAAHVDHRWHERQPVRVACAAGGTLRPRCVPVFLSVPHESSVRSATPVPRGNRHVSTNPAADVTPVGDFGLLSGRQFLGRLPVHDCGAKADP